MSLLSCLCCCCSCFFKSNKKSANRSSKKRKELSRRKRTVKDKDLGIGETEKVTKLDSKTNPEGLKVGKFFVGKYISGGSFGRIYTGRHMENGKEVAIKMELETASKPQLIFEFNFFRKLNAVHSTQAQMHKGIPKIYFFGRCGAWSALVMDMLGPSISELHERCGSRFSLKTTIYLANQLFELFEYFHGCGLIYRDTKPENFLFGRTGTDDYSVVHIIDLGLSKEYLDEDNNHIPLIDGKPVTGTVRYMSVNNHKRIEQSRRDDMEALGYMLVYLCKGELPWMGLQAASPMQKFKLIAKVKERTTPESLCADLPKEFTQYLNEVKSLEFTEVPKYRDYIKMFWKLFNRSRLNDDNEYDFDRNHRQLRKQ